MVAYTIVKNSLLASIAEEFFENERYGKKI
jgi:hypothetical protein